MNHTPLPCVISPKVWSFQWLLPLGFNTYMKIITYKICLCKGLSLVQCPHKICFVPSRRDVFFSFSESHLFSAFGQDAEWSLYPRPVASAEPSFTIFALIISPFGVMIITLPPDTCLYVIISVSHGIRFPPGILIQMISFPQFLQ